MRAPAFLQASSRSLPGSKLLDRAARRQARGQHGVLVLDVDDAELVAVLGIERVGEARRCRHELGIVEHDLARIDVADAVGILHRRDEVRGIGHLGIVDLLGQALLVDLVHVVGRQALDVGRAAAQRLLGHHLGAARRRLGLVLDDVPALGREQRRLDVLGEQARIVAAPGADDDALVVLRVGRQGGAGGEGGSAAQCRSAIDHEALRHCCLLFSGSVPPELTR